MHHDLQVRYARNLSLPEVGETGQKRLLASKVLVIGESLSGQMMVVDALNNAIRKVKLSRGPACACCGGR